MSTLLDHLRTFIAFRTVAKENQTKMECLDWIAKEFLSSSGLTPVQGEIEGAPYLVLVHPQAKLLWFGHIDVVPANDAQFSIVQDGDRILGRGVKDMKGADLTFLIAYREACELGKVPPVSIMLTSDEEIGGHTPPILFKNGTLGKFPVAYTPDNAESNAIITELKGAMWVKVIAVGKGGHGALPWKSRNPIPSLLSVVKSLQEKFPPGGEHDWQMTVSPTRLLGSTAMNQIPNEAWCMIDVRFPGSTAKTPDDVLKILRSIVPKEFQLEPVEWADPLLCDPKHPMVKTFQKIATEVTGAPVPLSRDHGSSDARVFAAAGIPAFLYGPMGGDLHGAREWVSLKSLEQHVEMYRRLFREF